ncbi:hypothetical protein Tco_0630360 [Tanacetum coccineum]
MTKKFEMSIMGELTYFLGLQIQQDDKEFHIVRTYSRNLLKKYEISNSSSVKTPMVLQTTRSSSKKEHPMLKISVQFKRVTSNSCEKNPQTMLVVIWIEKAPQVLVQYLWKNGSVGVQEKPHGQWLLSSAEATECPSFGDNTNSIAIFNHPVITEYLVNISKRREFWSLNEDILKITILTTNTPYPSRKIRRIRACTHQTPQSKQAQYVYQRANTPY